MNDVKLKKEAEEYAKENYRDEVRATARNAYLDCARLKEKQIQIDVEQIRALQKQNGELTDKVRELEKGNIGLQNKVDTLQGYLDHDIEFDMDKTIQELKKENAELKAVERMALYSKMSDQLAEAKEIIKDLLSSCFGYNSKTVNYEVKAKAEQFLKEE